MNHENKIPSIPLTGRELINKIRELKNMNYILIQKELKHPRLPIFGLVVAKL